MRASLKQFFIPHVGNNYHPHILHGKRVLFYGALGIMVKAIAVATILLMPLQVLVVPEVVVDQERRIIALTNEIRLREGVDPVVYHEKLHISSFLKAEDMVEGSYFEHVSPAGKHLSNFLKDAAYDFSVAGENLAVGFATPEDVVTAWVESPTHFTNLIDPDFKDIGVGSRIGLYQSVPSIYIAEHFGNPRPTEVGEQSVLDIDNKSTDPRVRGLTVQNLSDSEDVSSPYYDSNKSYVSWKLSGQDTIQLTAVARIVGSVKTAVVHAHGYDFSLYPTDTPLEWSGTLIVHTTPEKFFRVILPPSITIDWGDTVETIAAISWQNAPTIPPDTGRKYELLRHIPGIFGSVSLVSYAILYGMVVFFTLSLILKICIQIRHQHYHVIGSVLVLIVLLTLLAIA